MHRTSDEGAAIRMANNPLSFLLPPSPCCPNVQAKIPSQDLVCPWELVVNQQKFLSQIYYTLMLFVTVLFPQYEVLRKRNTPLPSYNSVIVTTSPDILIGNKYTTLPTQRSNTSLYHLFTLGPTT